MQQPGGLTDAQFDENQDNQCAVVMVCTECIFIKFWHKNNF
jgi:hypothetical protein